MTSLHRAIALPERDRVAAAVTQQLDLDVARALEVALAEHRVVAECRPGLAARGLERAVQLGGRPDDPHPPPAASRGRLHQQRKAELRRVALLEHRHSDRTGGLFRRQLVAARAQRLRRRADEHEARCLDRLGEVGVLGQEAVPGMDRVGTGA